MSWCMWCGKKPCIHKQLEADGVKMSVMLTRCVEPFFCGLSDPQEGRVSNTSGIYPRGVGPYRVSTVSYAHAEFVELRDALIDHPRRGEAITVWRDGDGVYRVSEEDNAPLQSQPA